MKLNNKTCKECKKKIEGKEKAVALLTYEKGNLRENVFFHFPCYLEWFNRSVNAAAEKKINEAVPIAMKQTKKMMPAFLQQLFPNDPEDTEADSS